MKPRRAGLDSGSVRPQNSPLTFACRFALIALAFAVPSGIAADMSAEQRTFFESRIRPVLVKQCYECHSADAKKLGGKLLLDRPSEMLSGGESGPAMVPGKPDDSLIVQALRYDGIEMPPKHRLADSVVRDFEEWVKMGAPDPRDDAPKPTAKTAAPDEAAMWAYRPIVATPAPAVQRAKWPRGDIDRFILAKIEANGFRPVADAAPAVLIRRVTYDLTGLPPTADEVDTFVKESATPRDTRRSFRRLVDRLLASPQFGEHWGRHWLDVARYGESNGNDGLSRNPSFPHAWRYRDYVIGAFNSDVPYDHFITEQIAGDLLPAESPAQRDRQLIATGFLALGAKPAKAMNDNFEMDVVADQIGVVGHGIMGLSVGCARCHDHKTEPISTRDYYALAGIFKSTETLWGAAAFEALTAPETPLHELSTAAKIAARPELNALLAAHKPGKAPAKPANNYAADAALAMGVREAKAVANCKINIGGEAKKLGPEVPRGFVEACSASGPKVTIDPAQSGRLQLAQWLTSPEHPQTARVMVNRVWHHLFGEGLVRTPDDFGVYGEKPTHPELLDHLAAEFARDGWSMKRLIRRIVLSRSYQLGSACDERLHAADPENRLVARHSRRRLDAEAFRDTVLAASGELDRTPGQGSVIQQRNVLINELGSLHQPSKHRSVYLLLLRNSMPPELTPFNLPDATAVTGRRDTSTLPTQALFLLNNPFLVEQSRYLAARLTGDSDAEHIRTAFRRVFTREPSSGEMERATALLRDLDQSLAGTHADTTERRTAALAAFCQSLFASNEMRYVD